LIFSSLRRFVMRVDTEQKLFVGLKLDSEMRRQHADGKVAHRPAFKLGDPARLELFDVKGDLFIGRVVDGSLACDEVGDLERNIRSIVAVTFSVPKPSGQLRIFAIDRNELPANLAAAS
jgi:hypothetical protein